MSDSESSSSKKRKGRNGRVAEQPFAAIMAAPVFFTKRERQVADGPLLLCFDCDMCHAKDIDPVVSSYADPEHDLCVGCHNSERKRMTDSSLVEAFERRCQDYIDKWIDDNPGALAKAEQQDKAVAAVYESLITLH